jgi:hypothetical protein
VTAPSLPTDITATGHFEYISIDWTNPADADLNFVEIWEADTDNSASATRVGISGGNTFQRTNLGLNVTKFYFLKAVDYSGNASAFTAGVSATTTFLDDEAFANGIYSLFTEQGLYAIEDVTSLPPSGDFVGQKVFNRTDGKLYDWTGTAWEASVSDASVGPGSITATEIADGAISTPKLAANAVVADKIAGNTITGNKIVANTITGGLLATSGIITNSAQINDALITNAKIANAAITTAKIGDAQISNAKIGNLQVDTIKIANNSVTTAAFAQSSTTFNLTNYNQYYDILSLSFSGTNGQDVLINFFFEYEAGSGNTAVFLEWQAVFNGSVFLSGAETDGNEQTIDGSVTSSYLLTPSSGTQTLLIRAKRRNSSGTQGYGSVSFRNASAFMRLK